MHLKHCDYILYKTNVNFGHSHTFKNNYKLRVFVGRKGIRLILTQPLILMGRGETEVLIGDEIRSNLYNQ